MKSSFFALLLPLAVLSLHACSSGSTTLSDDGGGTGTDIDSSPPGTLPDGARDPDAAPLKDGDPLPDRFTQDVANDPNPFAGLGAPAPVIGATDSAILGLGYVDGPQWIQNALFFTDFQAAGSGGVKGDVWKLSGPGSASATRAVSGSGAAIGICFDAAAGSMVLTEAATHAMTTRKPDGTGREILVGTFGGHKLNAPNDCVVIGTKGVYFTDPGYAGQFDPADNQTNEHIFRVVGTPPTTTVVFKYTNGEHPNGIAATADGATLYIGLNGVGRIVKQALGANGAPAGAPVAFAQTGAAPDGMATDTAGNVFVATTAGVEAYSPTGQKWGVIPLPAGQQPLALAFGDADSRGLYITSSEGRGIALGKSLIYKLTMRIPGIP